MAAAAEYARHLRHVVTENPVTGGAFALFVLLVLTAILGPALVPYDPLASNAAATLQAPSARHWFGTDQLGRDVFSRVVVATRLDLTIAFASVILVFVTGTMTGVAAGHFGGWVDRVVGRISDTIMAFPLFVLAMGIVAALGNTVGNIVLATAVVNFPLYVRVARAEANVRRDAGFVEAARISGNGEARVVLFHILPNTLPIMMVQVSLTLGYAILNAAGLSFIGLGVRPPTPEWGIMVADGANYIQSGEWWIALFPGLALMLAVFCFNLLGDGLRDLIDPPAADVTANPPLLSVEGVSVAFRTRAGEVKALERVSFSVARGETIAIVGESGSGKSVTAQAIMGILDPAGRVAEGRIGFGGMDLLQATQRELADMRGRELAMIFQNPRGALNPIRTVGDQIADVLARHEHLKGPAARARAMEMLALVKITDPPRRLDAYPFELSGGMCQRVMIALALACRPALLIADEPTTGLDVTTQAAIMDLIDELGRSRGMATVLITHDLGLAAEHCRRIVVMHAGHVVEDAPAEALFAAPRHPYTARLLAATPRPGRHLADLASIPGGLPDLRRGDLGGCRFLDRCERAGEVCRAPTLVPVETMGASGHHRVLCAQPIGEELAA